MDNSIHDIQACIENYFLGTHEADITRVKKAFHPDCKITGFIKESHTEMTLPQFCERINEARKSLPKEYDKKIISIDLQENIAMVKARVLVSEVYFTDYITLLCLNGEWKIRQKSFTDSENSKK